MRKKITECITGSSDDSYGDGRSYGNGGRK